MQILADGEPIEYDSSAGVPAEALGKRLSVRRDSNWAGYETLSLTSAETAPVGIGEFDPADHGTRSRRPASSGEQLETNGSTRWRRHVRVPVARGRERDPPALERDVHTNGGRCRQALAVHLTMSKASRNAGSKAPVNRHEPVAERGVLGHPVRAEVVARLPGSARVGALVSPDCRRPGRGTRTTSIRLPVARGRRADPACHHRAAHADSGPGRQKDRGQGHRLEAGLRPTTVTSAPTEPCWRPLRSAPHTTSGHRHHGDNGRPQMDQGLRREQVPHLLRRRHQATAPRSRSAT